MSRKRRNGNLILNTMKFTSGTIESLDESLDTVTLYNGDKVVYKATYTKLESADLYCKFNKLKYIK